MFRSVYAPKRSAKRRRGWRNAAAPESEEADIRHTSRLVLGLLQGWADGSLSATQLHRHLDNARQDGLTDPLVAKFASMGANQNAHKSLMGFLTNVGVLDVITPLQDSAWTHAVLPSSWISLLCREYPREFKLRLGADTSITVAFWTKFLARGAERKACADTMPLLRGKSASELKMVIPCAVHEDAGPCSKVLSANCITFSSLLGTGSERVTHFVCATKIKKRGDDWGAWRAILADFDQLAEGVGERLGGWRFLLLISKSDEEVRVNEYGFPSWASRHEICSECLCNRSSMPYTDLQRDALQT